jgi:hypothetical protein
MRQSRARENGRGFPPEFFEQPVWRPTRAAVRARMKAGLFPGSSRPGFVANFNDIETGAVAVKIGGNRVFDPRRRA